MGAAVPAAWRPLPRAATRAAAGVIGYRNRPGGRDRLGGGPAGPPAAPAAVRAGTGAVTAAAATRATAAAASAAATAAAIGSTTGRQTHRQPDRRRQHCGSTAPPRRRPSASWLPPPPATPSPQGRRRPAGDLPSMARGYQWRRHFRLGVSPPRRQRWRGTALQCQSGQRRPDRVLVSKAAAPVLPRLVTKRVRGAGGIEGEEPVRPTRARHPTPPVKLPRPPADARGQRRQTRSAHDGTTSLPREALGRIQATSHLEDRGTPRGRLETYPRGASKPASSRYARRRPPNAEGDGPVRNGTTLGLRPTLWTMEETKIKYISLRDFAI